MMIARTLSDRAGTSAACGTGVQDRVGGVGKAVVVLEDIVNTGLARLKNRRLLDHSLSIQSLF